MSSHTQPAPLPFFRNLLFATDFSPCSEVVLPYLRSIAEHYGSMVHVLHVLPPEPMLEIPLDRVPELNAERDLAREAMKTMLAGAPLSQTGVVTSIEQGQFYPVLERYVREKAIDLIAVGTHGRHGLKRLMLGSMAEQIFRSARSPVLTVSPEWKRTAAESAKFSSILFATDFSGGSEQVLEYAESLARMYHARLTLMHCVSAGLDMVPGYFSVDPTTVELSSQLVNEAKEGARRSLERMVSARTIRELKPKIIVECGLAAEMILRTAENQDADLIAMGARHATTSLVSHLPWATVSTVVRQAHCPVLTVRS